MPPARTLLSLLALLVVSSCGHDARPPSLLLLTLDTTRADRLGCYGWADAGTPNLDALAARGVRFARAYAPTPVTLPSHTALLTGTEPRFNGVHDNGLFRVDGRLETLAEVLGSRGYHTGAVVAAYPLYAEYGLDQGFEFYDDEVRGPGDKAERGAGEVVDVAAAWVGTVGEDEPFFLWAHFFDPHQPLVAPEPFASGFGGDGYQAEIAYMDAEIGRLFAALEERGRLDDTIVVAVADHGEGLGDHGELTHGFLLHDTTTRVPLIAAGPGIGPGGGVIEELVRLVDVAPTVAEWLDVPAPAQTLGLSCAGLVRGEAQPARAAFLETRYPRLHYGWSPLEAVVGDGWKLVSAPAAPRATDELFDLAADPGELDDLAARQGERLAELRARLAAEAERLQAPTPYDAGHQLDAEGRAALEALGYAGGEASAADFTGAHPRERLREVELFELGRGHLRARRFTEAEELVLELEAAEPEGIAAPFLRGLLLAARAPHDPRSLEAAVEAYGLALSRAPERMPVWRNLAEAQWLLGRRLAALGSLRTARALAPSHPDVRELYLERREQVLGHALELQRAGETAAAKEVLDFLLAGESDGADFRRRVEELR